MIEKFVTQPRLEKNDDIMLTNTNGNFQFFQFGPQATYILAVAGQTVVPFFSPDIEFEFSAA